MIPDAELIEDADAVTVWVAGLHAPADVWSLREAIAWAMAQADREKITLFRPPAKTLRAAWVKFDQFERLALVLGLGAQSDAA